MKLGLIGLQNTGKTTIFNALSKQQAEVAAYASTKTEPNLAVVEVQDERITTLSSMYNPKKTIYATIELIDFIGLSQGSAKDGAFSSTAMSLMKNTDAIGIVLRNFDSDFDGEPTPVDDFEMLANELILSDLIIVESRIEKLELGFKRGQKTAELQFEHKVMEKFKQQLEDLKPLRELELAEDEEKAVRGFQFLSQKQLMVILNSSDENFNNSQKIIDELSKQAYTVEFVGNFEMELAAMDDEEAAEFMEDMGITESASLRLTKAAYEMLGYISFFTVGKDEVRAWTIKNGSNAQTAAGAIHSDLARGFIRAECYSYDDILEHGSEKALREKGLFRLEGKTYIVKDGDILSIRFNV